MKPKPTTENATFADREYIKGNRKVVWEWIGEGLEGDYHPDDSEDAPLLRFSCFQLVNGEWEELPDSSYCTLLPVGTPPQHLARASASIHDAIADCMYKRRLQELSWLQPSDFEEAR